MARTERRNGLLPRMFYMSIQDFWDRVICQKGEWTWA